MKKNTSAFVWALVALASIGCVVLGAAAVARPHQNADFLSQPSSWVAFDADVLLTHASGEQIRGHYFRSVNGSSRRDLSGATGQTITIYNIAHRKYYNYRTDRGWQSQPMDIPADGIRPRPILAATHQRRAEMREGFALWEETTPAGDVLVKVQELNFFPVDVTRKLARLTEVYSDFRFQVPDETLFAPPADVAVAVLTTPGGLSVRIRQP